jgi:hypothetical protein
MVPSSPRERSRSFDGGSTSGRLISMRRLRRLLDRAHGHISNAARAEYETWRGIIKGSTRNWFR